MGSDIIEKLQKTQKTVQKLRDENNILRRLQREHNRGTNLIDNLVKEVAKVLVKVEPMLYLPAQDKSASDYGDVVGISDWHIGESVDARQTNNVNVFNYKQADKRIKTFTNKIVDNQKSRNLVVADLGDNIRGIIHGGTIDTEQGLMESLVKCVDFIATFLKTMLNHYETIDYYFVVGNHSRLTEYIVAKDKYKDYSWLIVQMLIRLFENEPRIKFNISETGYHLVKINTAQVLLFHGDTVRWYDESASTSRARLQDLCISLFDKKAKHFFSGHKHISTTVANQYGGCNIVSGTLVGSNEYGIQAGFSMIHPSQCMFYIDTEGDIEEVKHFKL